jgi:hypothetical protein
LHGRISKATPATMRSDHRLTDLGNGTFSSILAPETTLNRFKYGICVFNLTPRY